MIVYNYSTVHIFYDIVLVIENCTDNKTIYLGRNEQHQPSSHLAPLFFSLHVFSSNVNTTSHITFAFVLNTRLVRMIIKEKNF